MSDFDMNDAVKAGTDAMKRVLDALEAEENRLATELATVKAKRVTLTKSVAALADDKPKRRRGRPRKSDQTEAAVAA